MNNYKIEYKIKTLSKCTIKGKLDDFYFNHYDFNISDGWTGDAWIISSNIKSSNFKLAFKKFYKGLNIIIPRLSLINQCCIEHINEPFIINKEGSNKAFLFYSKEVPGVGFHFRDNELKILKRLKDNKDIPEEFYYYWMDCTNATRYISKLLLLFSAIDILVGTGKKRDWNMLDKILGKRLRKKIYGEIGNSSKALRNRLVHGSYLNSKDILKDNSNYFEIIHKKIIKYFNNNFLKKDLIEEIKNPQRNFYGNKNITKGFIASDDGQFDFKEILSILNKYDRFNDDPNINKYRYYFRKNIYDKY
jgi:hypothetical protein